MICSPTPILATKYGKAADIVVPQLIQSASEGKQKEDGRSNNTFVNTCA